MLVVGATVGLIAPISAQASNIVDIEEMGSYSRSTRKSSRLDNNSFTNKISGSTNLKKSSRLDSKTFINEVSEETAKGFTDAIEVQQHPIEAGTFSDTTTLDGKAVFWLGSIDGGNEITNSDGVAEKESTSGGYTFTWNLNTSFTGDDNLYVRIKTGEQGDIWKNKVTYHIETKDNSDAFEIDKIWYTFSPIDNLTAFVGPRIENYYMYITPSIYKPGALKSFKLGGNSNFGASTDVGYGFKYELDNGFAFASNIVDKGADSNNNGVFAPGGALKWDTQVAYTKDRWHVSGTYSKARNWSSHSYNATALAANAAPHSAGFALRGYWMPEEYGTQIPDVSLGYDIKDYGGQATGEVERATSYMIGLTWKDMFQPDDRIGFAYTQPLAATEVSGGGATGEVSPQMWEAYYSFRPNDSMEITPAIFAGNDIQSDDDDDIVGLLVTSKFKF